ncbi:MAG TPA: hypothetical protein VFU93_12725 [Acidimicrobiales bacterium]|nr:hypothetical protein [Acidimicrobiales bacterium]
MLVTRLWRLFVGLFAFGFGIALLVHADLGLGPWDVLHQGISERTGIPIGTVGIGVGALLLLLWIPLPVRIGFGTLANTVVIGLVIDGTLWLLPESAPLGVRLVEAPLGIVLVAIGSGFYIGAGLGAGPRDGLMTGLAARGVGSVRVVRTGIEVTVLVLGWLLGGTVGVATAVQAVTIGPLVQLFLDKLSLAPRSGRESVGKADPIPPRTEGVAPPR